MEYVTDLHLHSRYSRAVSQNMIFSTMVVFARQKGLHILSASDFTHPLWFKEMRFQFEEAGDGLYHLKSQDTISKMQTNSNNQSSKEVLFLLSTEIASIYTQGGKLRRIHNLIFAPNLETVEKINQELVKRGCNLNADGRPIIGMSSKNLLELILSINEQCMLIPCHVWTPHFGIYGSKSGFDSLEEAFEELADNVYGIETGISSDPEMNWRMKELSNRSILSFSDAHSPGNMGRECTVFELETPTYENIRKAIMQPTTDYSLRTTAVDSRPKSVDRIKYTIEFYPEEGKYHFSGHRNCKVSLSPQEVAQKGTRCPVCKKEFTEGVAIRIDQLGGADFVKEYEEKISKSNVKWHTDTSRKHPPFVKLVRLEQIVAASIGSTTSSMKTKELYTKIISTLGNKLFILLKAPLDEILKAGGEKVADGVRRVREGNIAIEAGYDGEYGSVKIFNKEEEKVERVDKVEEKKEQLGLF